MADEQGKWLNRETAERLLRGESLEAVDARARDQAERLSRVLGALSAQAAGADTELRGEQAALAAFRKAREAAGAERAGTVHAPAAARPAAPGADAGLVRIGAPTRTGIPARRPRRGRPVRLALAAAVTVSTLGGVAVAAGSGVLPTPFGDEPARPGASVSAGTATGRPHLTSPPSATPGAGTDTGTDALEGRTEGDRGTGPGPGEVAGPGDRTAVPGAPSTAPGTSNAGLSGSTGDGRSKSPGKNGQGKGDSGKDGKDKDGKDKDGKNGQGKGDSGKDGKDKDGKDEDGKDEGGKDGKDEGGKGQGDDDDGPARPGQGKGDRHRGAAPAPSAFAPHPGGPGHGQSAATPGPTYSAL
ncbi:hypothetical protein ACH4L5_15475 [Streptomyces sp. NPDC017405]|uniref:hypothetical protein n=1 Tax=unclassified Streptomyces TaxID=2593676 RepID=UPI0037A99352